MACSPKLLVFSVLLLPLFTLGQFPHFSRDLRHTIIARASRSNSPSRADEASAVNNFLPYDAAVKVPHFYNKLRSLAVRQGVNGDPCSSASDCQGDRRCAVLTESQIFKPCAAEDFNCFCFQPSACYASSDCDDGEVCFDLPHSAVHMCMSEQTGAVLKGSIIEDGNSTSNAAVSGESGSGDNDSAADENGSENSESIPIENGSGINGQGLTGDPCSSQSDCQGNRECQVSNTSNTVEQCQLESTACYCFQVMTCFESSDCDSGEVCFDFPDTPVHFCVSEQAAAKMDGSIVEDGTSATSAAGPGESGSEINGQGLTGDPCSSHSDCKGNRQCTELDENITTEQCHLDSIDCYCFQVMTCFESSDCDNGEICVDLPDSEVRVCVSQKFAAEAEASNIGDGTTGSSVAVSDENGSQDNGSVAVVNGSGIIGQGLNGDPCSSKSDCQGDRQCLETSATNMGSELCPPGTFMCFCYKIDSSCSSISDCDDGEVCFEFTGKNINLCLSEPYAEKYLSEMGSESGRILPGEPEPTPPIVDSGSTGPASNETEPAVPIADECNSTADCEDGEECVDTDGSFKCTAVDAAQTQVTGESPPVCIAAHHLSELKPDDLMYSKHVLARVLCDKYNNCGTAGHIVKYKGKAMMMSSYCGIEHCSETIREVNSPKYVRGMLVASNSNDLEFTTLAARYNSRVEEALLSLAFRMGL